MISLGGDAARKLAGLPLRQPGALDPFRLADVSILMRALESAGGVKKDASELMGISQRALSYYLAKYRID